MTSMARKKHQSSQANLLRLINHLGKYHWLLIFSLLATIVIAACDIIAPRIMGDLTNGIAADISQGQAINFDQIKVFCLYLIAIYLVLGLFRYFQGAFADLPGPILYQGITSSRLRKN